MSHGKEIWRRLDQERSLYYGRITWKETEGIANSGQLTISFHSHDQERNRMKGNNTGLATEGDLQTFELDDFGSSARFEKEDFLNGSLSYGSEWHHEKLVSGGYKFDANGNRTANLAQGPLAADASYDRFSTYFQYEHQLDSGWSIEPGIRYSATKANLREFYENNSDALPCLLRKKKDMKKLLVV